MRVLGSGAAAYQRRVRPQNETGWADENPRPGRQPQSFVTSQVEHNKSVQLPDGEFHVGGRMKDANALPHHLSHGRRRTGEHVGEPDRARAPSNPPRELLRVECKASRNLPPTFSSSDQVRFGALAVKPTGGFGGKGADSAARIMCMQR